MTWLGWCCGWKSERGSVWAGWQKGRPGEWKVEHCPQIREGTLLMSRRHPYPQRSGSLGKRIAENQALLLRKPKRVSLQPRGVPQRDQPTDNSWLDTILCSSVCGGLWSDQSSGPIRPPACAAISVEPSAKLRGPQPRNWPMTLSSRVSQSRLAPHPRSRPGLSIARRSVFDRFPDELGDVEDEVRLSLGRVGGFADLANAGAYDIVQSPVALVVA